MASAAGNPFGDVSGDYSAPPPAQAEALPEESTVAAPDTEPPPAVLPEYKVPQKGTEEEPAPATAGAGNPFGGSAAPASPPAPGAETESSHAVTKVGTLRKKGNIPGLMGYTWKLRYVRVADGKLSYHETKAQAASGAYPVKGNVIDLDQYIVENRDETPNHIILKPVDPGKRVWEFDCEDTDTHEAWLAAMQANGADKASWAEQCA